jgi:hypothetical protein
METDGKLWKPPEVSMEKRRLLEASWKDCISNHGYTGGAQN